jgi:hypothetical protein
MATKGTATLGFKPRTGWSAIVAVAGPPDAPEILAKTRIDVATSFEEGAVFHMAQELPLEKARALVHDSELRFTELARTKLAAFKAQLTAKVIGAGMAAPPSKALPPLEAIVKSHARVHAAEGELYRRVFEKASTALRVRTTRVAIDELTPRVAAALRMTPAAVAARLLAMGKASGKPWTADQKQAALAAWIALIGQ